MFRFQEQVSLSDLSSFLADSFYAPQVLSRPSDFLIVFTLAELEHKG